MPELSADPAMPDPSAAGMGDRPAPTGHPQRRRLWQLPAEHRAFVVGLGLPPATLRRTAEQALAQRHRVRVALSGSDADVLASVLCDLGARNALSEAVQAQLARRHAVALARVAVLREPGALREAWRAALAIGDVPGTAWALLTHRHGQALDDALLVDLRGWTFAQASAQRDRWAADSAQREAMLQARADADQLRLRLQQEQARAARERDALAHELARWRGECTALREAVAPASPKEAAAPRPRVALPQPAHGLREPAPAQPAAPPVAVAPMPQPVVPPAAPIELQGRRVLCVGGMPGAQDRYRHLVETAGARFDFHDGGLEQGLHRLDRQLGAADLVVCQAGCLNHEAYRRVKGHCRRADKTCLFVERPSLALFARKLGLAPRHEPGPAA